MSNIHNICIKTYLYIYVVFNNYFLKMFKCISTDDIICVISRVKNKITFNTYHFNLKELEMNSKLVNPSVKQNIYVSIKS